MGRISTRSRRPFPSSAYQRICETPGIFGRDIRFGVQLGHALHCMFRRIGLVSVVPSTPMAGASRPRETPEEGTQRIRLNWIVLLAVLSSASLSSCGTKPIERALVGRWVSDSSPLIFEFREDRTFVIDDPTPPDYRRMTGTYRALGYQETLEDAQFVLKGGLDIRFTYEGNAFFIYIDGMWSPDELFRRDEPHALE